jgi:hypothetical protein
VPILRLAGKAATRRRPVNSALGITLNNVGANSNGLRSEQSGAHPSGIRSTATPTARTSCSRVRQAAAVQSVGGSAATRQTAPDGTTAGGGGEWHRLQSFQRSCLCSLSRIGRRKGSTLCAFHLRPAMPNPALNRSANGKSPWPRGACGSSCASRPRRLAVVARLALR